MLPPDKETKKREFSSTFWGNTIFTPFLTKGRHWEGQIVANFGRGNRKRSGQGQTEEKKELKTKRRQQERKLANSLYGRNLSFFHLHGTHTFFLLFFLLPLAKIDWPRERGLSRGTNASRKRSDHNKSQSKTEENVDGQRRAALTWEI